MTLWHNICDICVKRHVSLTQLKRHSRLSDGVFRDLQDKDKCNPKLKTLKKIAKALDVPVAYLFVPELLQINERLK